MQTLLIPCVATLLLDENRSLKDLQNFMQNDPALLELGKKSPFPAHRHFFETAFLNKSYEHTKTGIYTRIQSLLNNDGFYRATTGRSTMHLEKAINEGKIIIVRFTKDKGEEASRAFNKLLIARLQSIVLGRADQPKEYRKPCFLFIDEFQNYLSPSIGLILEESRKFGLHLVIANQNLGQITDTRLLRTILSNTFTKLVGANGFKDLKDFAAEIGVKTTQLQQLPPYKFYCKSGSQPAFVFEPDTFLIGHQPPFFLDKKQAGQLKEYLLQQSGQYQDPAAQASSAEIAKAVPAQKLAPKYPF
ncbi:Type IV secretion-system coupling protein DNA-binding domain-containing protein [Flexibacter flexilis DSM 6793]|uniref:Type IV secretion-system coupling protein DNA-binding domain-containing protein n=1 Tax=Flexibacter flexilis DSM 6793 TaxID=927664 RepID=A0A1I1P0X9_9BACT|nr:type IV secretory system conjugative DNA transfer family protein [Flexibacter flexilis]SFD03316.1 Type IV secretion-system coupling protein DNA-binding domain-containing protein [Flexibacter flexilis DSM 6793]